MKKLFVILIIALLATYAAGAIALSERGANAFLNDLEHLSLSGQGNAYCARLHEDLEVSVNDRTGQPPAEFAGGKKEFCAYVSNAAKGMDLLGVSTQLTRNDFTVTRNWLHPWTAEVSYDEVRTTVMSKVNVTLNSVSEDQLTLVLTFGGIKVKRLHAVAQLAH
jgi:hypothetical protein